LFYDTFALSFIVLHKKYHEKISKTATDGLLNRRSENTVAPTPSETYIRLLPAR